MNTQYITCRECGTNNAPNAKQCAACGADLFGLGNPSATANQKNKSIVRKIGDWIADIFSHSHSRQEQPQKSTTWLTHSPDVITTPEIPASEPPAAHSTIIGNSPAPATAPILPPRAVGQKITDRYIVRKYTKQPTGSTIFYDAIDLVCPNCQRLHENLPESGACAVCQKALNPALIHERQRPPSVDAVNVLKQHLLQLGQQNHPYILYHQELLSFTNVSYSIVTHPGRWGYVVPGNRTLDEVIAIVTQMGKALNFLHQQDFSLTGNQLGTEILESWIALPGCNEVRLADISTCLPMSPQNRTAQVARDILFLAQVLFYLTSGMLSNRPDPSLSPAEFRAYIEKTLAGHYTSPMDFMQDLSSTPVSPVRQLNPSHGQATDPGKKHAVNEDAIVTFTYNKQQSGKSVPVGFYLIADGMGGHDAGDLASRTVNQIVTNWVLEVQVLPDLRKTTRKLTTENVPAEILKQGIAEANRALQQHAQSQNSNLGSTVTATLLIGDTATVVNVGDSRTYRLRNRQLEQITRDHSLVARLVETNVITPEEVRSHPRRNEIYRSLGHSADIKIDIFTVQLQRGDRLILCSDGLWEMVQDADIVRIVQATHSPQEACDQLITAANAAGGDDNISVIVVVME